ncbi:MAG: trigger factor [Candidatus Nomurabacteria bacterium]|jgi:trigger factor|nr:trigger factor [Candidatus Nomurabacteria bacterium]
MKKILKKLDENTIQISVTLEAAELKAAEQTAADELAKDADVKGFRKGKVPADVAKKNVDPMALANRTAETAINNALVTIINEEKIRPLDRPNVELGDFKPNQSLKFVVKITTVPTVKLGNYKKLGAKKPDFKIQDADIEQVVDNLLTGQAEKKSVKRPAQAGDETVIDFTGRFTKSGKEFNGGDGKDFPLRLGGGQFIPGFEDAIVGHKTGEEFDVPLTFPKDYQAANLAGQKVIFKTRIKSINELKKPELNDEFAASLGAEHIKTVADLRADIERELNGRAERNTTEQFRSALIDELIEKTNVKIPEILVLDQLTTLEREFVQNLTYQQKSLEDYLSEKNHKDKEAWIKAELEPVAEKRAKAGLILSELATQEGITVNDTETDARIQAIQMQYNDPQLKQMYENPEARRNVANQILTDKTFDRLVELNS